MDTQEFLDLSDELNTQLCQDQHQFELYSFMTVWLKSRMPSLYKELETNFRRIEPNVYTHQACIDHRTDRDRQAF